MQLLIEQNLKFEYIYIYIDNCKLIIDNVSTFKHLLSIISILMKIKNKNEKNQHNKGWLGYEPIRT